MNTTEICRIELERYLEQLKDRDVLILTLTGRIRDLEEELKERTKECDTLE